ncbi:RNA polymerase sigma factor FliA [Methylophaga pinxianii]|uniref:RNA polymerase sigma factor FliA n=1 Tax=Methylophaga pinxianii TaxID=2881052 RepID=UPI001CF10D28|nr:RNA polymerase sigma factor FliA [Methylophaga pinxianii]MCB2426293.1 RNA polymerase sigma factor FliA [Methylophaga pinxianii]UPH46700.1 RNA polymerase sigma factor FliA [Methylophaga pinxianii]
MYSNQISELSQHQLIEQHGSLVKRIAYHLVARLPHTVEVNDLIQAGMIGLLDASHQYKASQGASFETYAGIRIRGAMLDEIRRNDWAPRSVHRKAREIAEVMHQLEQQLGRSPLDMEVADAMGMSLEQYHQQLQDASGHQVFSLDDMTDNQLTDGESFGSDDIGPAEITENNSFERALAEAIDALPERERLLMSLYYNEELNLKEIGEVLGVSESRVSQIHTQTVVRLRSKLRDWMQ